MEDDVVVVAMPSKALSNMRPRVSYSCHTTDKSIPMRPTVVDEVRRLFAIYKTATGREPMAGGAQNLIRLGDAAADPTDLFAECSDVGGRRKPRLDTLTEQMQVEICEYLNADDLCALAMVSRRW